MAATLSSGKGAYAAEYFVDGWLMLNVPDDWTIERTSDDLYGRVVWPEEGLFTRVSSPDGEEVMTFEHASSEGLDSRQFAENVSGHLKGSSPVVKTERGDFEFVFTEDGVKTTARAFMIESVGIVMRSRKRFNRLYDLIGIIGWEP